MPYVEIADGTKLWYRTNMPVQSGRPVWDASKPSVLLMQCKGLPLFTDGHLQDPTLKSAFNLISFDIRSTGKTKSTFDPRRDTWTDAADYAQAITLLGLPALHVFAAGGELAHLYALYLAVLWDGLVASITFVDAGARPECALDFQVDEEAITDVMRDMVSYEDLESFERMGHELGMFIFGNDIPDDVVDVMVANFEIYYSGRETPRLYDYMMEVLHEAPLNRLLLKHVAQPCLFITSDCTTVTLPHISIHPDELINAEVQVETLHSPPQPHIVQPWSKSVFKIFKNFVLDHHHPETSKQGPTSENIKNNMSTALRRLAQFSGRPELTQRDPMLSASFSQAPEEVIRRRQAFWDELMMLLPQKELGKVLDSNGKPFRKFSERNLNDYQALKTPMSSGNGTGFMSVTFSETTESREEEEEGVLA